MKRKKNGLKELHRNQPTSSGLKGEVPMRRRGERMNGPQNLDRKMIGASQDKMVRKEVVPKQSKVMRGINVAINILKIRFVKINTLSMLWLQTTIIGISLG